MSEEVGFIPEFRDFILQHIPTMPDWSESIAISLLSTAVGGDVTVRSKIGKLKLNLWFLTVGPSGMAYKSTPLNYFVFPVLKQLTEELGETTISPSRFSIEGMIEWLTKHPQGSIVRDEFTTVFKETTKGYLSDNLEFMSELYDGRMQKRFTRKTKLEETSDVYITFLAATTPYLYRIMKPDFFVQGTGNRMLYIMYEGLDKETLNDRPEDFFYDRLKDILRDEKLGKYAKDLAAIRQSNLKELCPDIGEAGQKWLDFRKGVVLKANKMFTENAYDLRYTYMTRLPELTLKLSALHAISTHYKSLEKIGEEMPIMSEDMDWAILQIRKYFKHFEKLLNNWRPEMEAEISSLGDATTRLYTLLSSYNTGMSYTEMRNKIPWEGRFLKEIISSLFEQEKIGFAIGNSTSAGGKRPTIIYTKTNEKSIDKEGLEKLVGWDQFLYRTHLDKVR